MDKGVASDEARAGLASPQAPTGLGHAETIANAAQAEREAIVAWGHQFADQMQSDFAAKLAKLPPWEREGADLIYNMGISTIRLVIGGIEAGRHHSKEVP